MKLYTCVRSGEGKRSRDLNGMNANEEIMVAEIALDATPAYPYKRITNTAMAL